MKPRVGLLVFAEQREEFYVKRKSIVKEELEKIKSILDEKYNCTIPPLIRSKQDMLNGFEQLRIANISSLIICLPIWSAPNFPLMAARMLDVPTILLSNNRLDSSSQVALLAVGGALDQIGLVHKRVVGEIGDSSIVDSIDSFCKAAHTRAMLKGTTYGSIGGRSLGICTATADLAQWQNLFGIDIEHIDQFEIVRIAKKVDAKQVQRYKEWIEKNFGKIEFNGDSFTTEKLDLQIRSYLATKKIIQNKELDFIGIKCQTEMSDHFVLQCLNQSMLNDPYDADGEKEPIVSSCECDHDGALSMQILKILSGGKPTLFLDIRNVSNLEIIGANCGSMPTWFTNYSFTASDNLSDVHLIPHAFGKAGGGAVQLVAGPAQVTLARLCRKKGNYWMAIMKGSIVKKPREELKKTTWSFPHAFIQAEFDKNEFLSTYGSNHIHGAVGDYVNDLVEFCKLLSLDYKVFSR